jgi:hypothetical protein
VNTCYRRGNGGLGLRLACGLGASDEKHHPSRCPTRPSLGVPHGRWRLRDRRRRAVPSLPAQGVPSVGRRATERGRGRGTRRAITRDAGRDVIHRVALRRLRLSWPASAHWLRHAHASHRLDRGRPSISCSRRSGTPPWPPRAAPCTPDPPTVQPATLGCEGNDRRGAHRRAHA